MPDTVWDVYHSTGLKLMRKRQFEKALYNFDLAIQLEPNHSKL